MAPVDVLVNVTGSGEQPADWSIVNDAVTAFTAKEINNIKRNRKIPRNEFIIQVFISA